MHKVINVFRGTDGLNTVGDKTKVRFNPDTGITELSTAVNVDVDDYGRVSRRKGFDATVRTESVHSLWAEGNDCFYISGDSLYRLNKDYTRTGLRSGLTVGARCAFLNANFRIYYMNGYESGYVINNVSYAWEAGTYTGPPTTEVFSDPPIGTHLELYNGRIYVAKDNQLFYSEPFAYSWFNLASGYTWVRNKLRFVKSVLSGLYVGTSDGVVFLMGDSPKDMRMIKISDSPPVEYTDVKLNGSLVGLENTVVMWIAEDGVWIGTDGGKAQNISKEKIIYPSAILGSGVVYNKKYLSLLEE
jgi:hypothetical protein